VGAWRWGVAPPPSPHPRSTVKQEQLINSNQAIVVDACWRSDLAPDILGSARATDFRQNFTNAPIANTGYPMALANALASSDLNGSISEITVNFNSTFSWYFGVDANTPASQYDFASVVLHEVGHGLGFAGLGRVDTGNNACGTSTIGDGCIAPSGTPQAYDRFTEDGNGTRLLNYGNPSAALGNALTGNAGGVFFDGANASAANGARVPLYTPRVWEQGSSYSHDDDLLIGTPGDDVILGMGGNDRIVGLEGNDCLDGGDGRDWIGGGEGNDLIFGRAGGDTIVGDSGDDLIAGGDARDLITGGLGNDVIFGDAGSDQITGNSGDDLIAGGAGADSIDGGAGNDRIFGGDSGDHVIGGTRNDAIFGDGGSDWLAGNDGDDSIVGDVGADSIDGGAGNDQIFGGDDSDRLIGGTGSDSMKGGLGDDRLQGNDGADDLDGGPDRDRLDGGSDTDVCVNGEQLISCEF